MKKKINKSKNKIENLQVRTILKIKKKKNER